MNSRQLLKMCSSLLLAAALVGSMLLDYQPAQASIYSVINTNDSGVGSLRAAIINANSSPGPHTIQFNISGCGQVPSDPPCVIQPLTALPALQSGGITIDGYTQPGASPTTTDTPANIKVELDGGAVINDNGLNIYTSNNVIRGLSIHRFLGSGLWIGIIGGSIANNNLVEGNYLGFDADLSIFVGNGLNGVFIGQGAQNNTIGGNTPAARNVISANGVLGPGWSGIGIHGALTSGNKVIGNYIGAYMDGAGGLENAAHGVHIYGGAHDNIIGGDTAGERNLLSGNTRDGVRIEGTGSDNNQVMGNYIGLDLSGISTVENRENGVRIMGGAQNNTIGGDTAAKGNVISGNMKSGVRINGASTQGNVVANNYIGPGSDGSYDLGNEDIGIYLFENAADTIIGPGNLISGNSSDGIWIDGAHGTHIFGNSIGTDASGNTALGNESHGVMASAGATDTLIGGDSSVEGNIISGNGSCGVFLADTATISTTISGDYIGLAANGDLALGNNGGGICIENGVQDVTIGGSTSGERNLVSGNDDYGIVIYGPDTQRILISGNYVGTDASGMLDRGNAYTGVHIYSGAHNVTVGGDTPGERNIISGNDESGIDFWGGSSGLDDIVVSGNYIGLAADGSTELGNTEYGIIVSVEATNLTIGGDTLAERNVISANGYHGIYMEGSDVTGNTVIGNYIGTDASGTLDRGNGRDGVHISVFAHDNTIGPGNRIAYNTWDGVGVDTPISIGNVISENSIFSNGLTGIDLTNGGNNAIQPPVIDGATFNPFLVSGTACTGCLVEVFQNPDDDGEGKFFLGSTTAHALTGDFSLTVGLISMPYLTASATDSTDGTSEFSLVYDSGFRAVFLPWVTR